MKIKPQNVKELRLLLENRFANATVEVVSQDPRLLCVEFTMRLTAAGITEAEACENIFDEILRINREE